jgi:hypothetical protein
MKHVAFFFLAAGLICPTWAAEPTPATGGGAESIPAPVLVELQSGKLTFVDGASVKISGSSQPAKTGDPFVEKAELETGASPATEVTFGDGSVMRLGEKTKVSYSAKERIVRVAQGTVLFHSPPGNGGITLQGEKATGQVAGSTVMGTQDGSGNFSFLLLEGSGAGSVTGGTAGPTFVGIGEMTTIRSGAAEAPEVVEVHVDAVRDISPLFQQISSSLPSATKVVGTTDQQAMEIQTDIKLLSSLDNFKLTESDPEGVSLAMICGVGQDEIGAAKNILLRPVDTAAGTEELASASSSAPATVQAVIGGLNGLSGASSGLASASAVLSAVSPALQSAANSNDPKSLQAFTFAAVSAVAQGDPGAVQSIVSGLISAIAGSPQAGDAATIVAAAAIVTASNFGESAMQAASAGAIAGALASGNPALVQAVNQGLANGTVAIVQGTVVAAGTEAAPADARQAEAEPLVAAVAPAGSGDGLAGTETAAGGEGDLGATETAAGGGGGADTQAPLAPVVTSPTPGLTTPI